METIQEIQQALRAEPSAEDLLRWSSDPRKGVQKELAAFAKREEKKRLEEKRLAALYTFEEKYYAKDLLVAGCDEAGRGPVAGPVTVAAVILPPHWQCSGLNDSKKLSAAKREALFEIIRKEAIAYRIVHVSAAEIDRLNIYQAVCQGMKKAVEELNPAAGALLSDAMPVAVDMPIEALIKGDSRSASIAAASILAKVSRDRLMDLYAQEYPGYGFEIHKGYLTEAHRAALDTLGPCAIHRQTFEPIKSMIGLK